MNIYGKPWICSLSYWTSKDMSKKYSSCNCNSLYFLLKHSLTMARDLLLQYTFTTDILYYYAKFHIIDTTTGHLNKSAIVLHIEHKRPSHILKYMVSKTFFYTSKRSHICSSSEFVWSKAAVPLINPELHQSCLKMYFRS